MEPDLTENTDKKQRGRFKKGQSGNPAGKPKGARNRATMAAETLLEGEAENLTRKAIEKALEGDSVALKLCLDRILPRRREAPIFFKMPKFQTASDLPKITEALLRAVSVGEILPHQARSVAEILENHRRTLETQEMEQRIIALEKEAGINAFPAFK